MNDDVILLSGVHVVVKYIASVHGECGYRTRYMGAQHPYLIRLKRRLPLFKRILLSIVENQYAENSYWHKPKWLCICLVEKDNCSMQV